MSGVRISSRATSTEPAGDVIFRFPFGRTLENDLGLVEFDQVAQQKEAGEFRYAGGLLHVVRNDHLRALVFEGEQQIFDLRGGNGIESRTGLIEKQNFRIHRQSASDA